jgi:D-inositol-3-phosphate glycosyltransferase
MTSSDGPVVVVSAWWPRHDHAHERPFVPDHARAVERAVGRVACWAVIPGLRTRGARPLSSAATGLPVTARAPRVPWRLASTRPGFAALFCAGWLQGRRLQSPPPAVLLQGFDYAGPYALGLARGARSPLVYLEHWSAVATSELSGAQLATLRRVVAGADVVLAVSRYLAGALERAGNLPAGSVGVVGNVVDPTVFPASPPPRRAGVTITQVADFRPVKGHDLLVETLAELGGRRLDQLDLRFVLVGDGPGRRAVERRLGADPALARRVRFTGTLPRREVARAMGESDWTLLTSTSETFSCVSLESLAVGRPVIAPRVGALEALVSDDDGILYERSAAGLADALLQAARRRRGDGWRRRSQAAVARFGPDVLSRRYEAVFRSLGAATP